MLRHTLGKRIAGVTTIASTHRGVTNHVANRAHAARIDARVATFLVDAGKLIRALAVAGTLWATIGGRSYEFSDARAGWLVVDHLTLCVRSTGGWLARVNWRWWSLSFKI